MIKRKLMRVLIGAMLLVMSLSAGSQVVYAQDPTIRVDGQVLVLPQDARGPVISREGRVLVPARWIAEALGVEVSWDPFNRQAVFEENGRRTVLTLDEREASLDGKIIRLDSPAVSLEGRTFVPVRFISEAFDARVVWQPESRQVDITSFQQLAAMLKQTIHFRGVGVGDATDQVIRQWGEPLETFPSEYGFDWWVYHDDYEDYVQVGVEQGMVVAVYTNSTRWSSDQPIDPGTTRTALRKEFGTPLEWVLRDQTRYLRNVEKESDLYFMEDIAYVEFFYDMHEGQEITAVKWVLKRQEESLEGFLGNMSPEMVQSHERQLFLLANAVRVRMGLRPFEWHDQVARVARKHSQDMGERDYFDHVTPEGINILDRLLAGGLRVRRGAENIAANLTAIDAHEALMNSAGHRVNLLSDLGYMGTGTSLGHTDGTFEIYHTQNFISF